jgi:transcription initiation factor IIE alpha subunit
MNHWLQTKLFTCQTCGARYTHDRAYRHDVFDCPNRERPARVT